MPIPLFHVDAFTDRPFGGNPAAVCLLSDDRDDSWLQHVAAEMNLSETAFVQPHSDGYRLRWFTPVVEVDLCGHATLAAAHVLWNEGMARPQQVLRFHTRSGVLAASRRSDNIELDFPREAEEEAAVPADLAAGLGAPLRYVGRNRFDYLAEVNSEATLRSLTPDISLLARVPMRGVIVTSRSEDSRYDFVSRFFAPAVGVAEDPVCGSAHCCLGPYWSKCLGKDSLVGYQASARGGVVRVRISGDRVFLGGQAVVVARGTLVAE